MVADQPFVDYNAGKSRSDKRRMIATKQEEDEMRALVEAWEKDRQGKRYSGKRFSLDAFLRGDVD